MADCRDHPGTLPVDLGDQATRGIILKTSAERPSHVVPPFARGLGKGEVDVLNGEISWYEGLPRVYVVQKGDFLYKISEMDAIYGDPLKWKRIYRANRELIEDPNLIYPDWELTIPRDWPHSYTVKIGENLWRIAGYWEIYGDATMWSRIYEANQAEIPNPDVIQPGQILTIPR